jgi:hypothetical protein
MLSCRIGEVMVGQPRIGVAKNTWVTAASMWTSHLMRLTTSPEFSLGDRAPVLERRAIAWTPSPSMCGDAMHLRLDGAWP